MVTNRKSWFRGAVALAACAIAFAWFGRPRLGNGEQSIAGTVTTAIGVYRRRHGQLPESFTDLHGVLEEVAHSTCRITPAGQDRYRINMVAEDLTFEMDVLYRRGRAGELEKIHVFNVGRRRTRN